MKRVGNIYEKIYDMENLRLADKKARRGKRWQRGVIKHNRNREENLLKLQRMLIDRTYKTSPYKHFKINDGKERNISSLPYFPDRILHHAVIQVIDPILTPTFTRDTYSCIKGRGLQKAVKQIKDYLKDRNDSVYYLKMDISKFYPTVNHDVLKMLIRRKIKCFDTLNLLDELIDSAPGIPLGNYTSQPLGNFYLAYFDHYVKEKMKAKKFLRYCDDLLFLSGNKEELHRIRKEVVCYLDNHLGLQVKQNWRIAPVETGLDILGYVFRHDYVFLRKRIKRYYMKMMKYRRNSRSISAYGGWLKWCNSKNLQIKAAS